MNKSKEEKLNNENKKDKNENMDLSEIEKTFQYKNFEGSNC